MKKITVISIVILTLILCVIIPSIKSSHFTNIESGEAINHGWEYRIGDSSKNSKGDFSWLNDGKNSLWKSFTAPGNPPNENSSKFVWERVKLPKSKIDDPSIYFYTYNQSFQFFINGKQIYSFGQFDSNSVKLPGSFWHIIDLPQNYEGKYVYIRLEAVSPSDTGTIINFELGSKSNILLNVIESDIISFSIACLFLLLGIIGILICIINLKYSKLIIYFSLCCISAGGYFISQGNMKQLFFYAPNFWEYARIIFQYSIPITFGLLINEILEHKYSYIYLRAAYFHMLLLLLSLIGDFLNVMPINSTIYIFYFSFALSMAMSIITILRCYTMWNKEIKIFVLGFTILCFSGIYDIVNWNFNPSHSENYVGQWGIFIFLISLCMVVIVRYVRNQSEAAIVAEELKSKEKSLLESKQQVEFFANISHELRTPLNIILNTLQLFDLFIKDGSIKIEGKDTSNYFKIMKQNCYRLVKLVNNLIDINRIDSGYLQPNFENRDIVKVVEDITQSVADYIKSMGISIVFDTNVEEKVISCDMEKIERIILNFLSNAVKFSKEGSSILVDVEDAGDIVNISIKDTGIGIKEEKLKDIFGRFVQVDKSFTRNHEGSGIGLSLVKALVEMHGGTISVKSTLGEGSTFTITLPAIKAEDKKPILEGPESTAIYVEKVNIEFSDIYS